MAISLNKVCNSVAIVVHALASYLCLCVSFRHSVRGPTTTTSCVCCLGFVMVPGDQSFDPCEWLKAGELSRLLKDTVHA